MKYCGRGCQVAHWSQHKNACKKRAAELEEELFRDPPEKEECPICMLPLPFDLNESRFQSCCGKFICMGCSHAQQKEDFRSGKAIQAPCAFCRTPGPKGPKEFIDQLKRGVERNDMASIEQLAEYYIEGTCGLEKDSTKAMVLLLKAGKLGCADAYYTAGNLYFDGNGVEKDEKKARLCYELGTIGGSIRARHNFAKMEGMAGRDERASKHFLICVIAGYELSLDGIKIGLEDGYITKDEYAEAMRAFHKSNDETKSAMRDEALVYDANPSLYFNLL